MDSVQRGVANTDQVVKISNIGLDHAWGAGRSRDAPEKARGYWQRGLGKNNLL